MSSKLPSFMDPNSDAAAVLNFVLEIAGPNFGSSYVGDAHPNDITEANSDILIQYDGPGGTRLKGTANPGSGGNIGTAINSMLTILSPFISGYAMLMPIFGIIIGIIEVVCSLLNPWAVGDAVKRLFEKWIPPFVSLFPPLAGVIISSSTIKTILAIAYYVMVEIIPTVELIATNIISLAEAFENIEDLTEGQVRASLQKFTNVLDTLIQKIGLFEVFRPLLEFIFLILLLLLGMPCDPEADGCCNAPYCPCELSDPPTGSGILLISGFGDCAPNFIFSLFTSNPVVAEYEQFQQNAKEQLDCQLDEPVSIVTPSGATSDSASLLKLKITSKRGEGSSIIVPILDIDGTIVKVNSPIVLSLSGQIVDYEIIPDYKMMVARNVIGIGCDPDIANVKENIRARFPQLQNSLLGNNPELGTVVDDYNNINDAINQSMRNMRNIINEFPPDIDGLAKLLPFDDQVGRLRDESAKIVAQILAYTDDLKDKFNALLGRNVSSASSLDVDKSAVKADAIDAVTVIVTPRDITGSPLIKDVPEGVGVSVQILTDFGSLTNQQIDTDRGVVTAEIRSPVPGIANIKAKVSGKFITNFDANVGETIRSLPVRFISEAILPKRRRKSKPSSGRAIDTGVGSKREPGRG